jgi:hypothetical protein
MKSAKHFGGGDFAALRVVDLLLQALRYQNHQTVATCTVFANSCG